VAPQILFLPLRQFRSHLKAAALRPPVGHAADCGRRRRQVSIVSLTLCVLLWARAGAEDGLISYEDQVLGIVGDHGGQLLQRARSSGAGSQPLEIQLLEFPSRRALDAFMADPRRQALAGERDKAISQTEVIEVQLVQHLPET
jgi:uncharacterized protein (DUF1330 family)